jgi:NADP-dependent 3-hydroxy acid dehydrogenase YdfG/acyl carrier protein
VKTPILSRFEGVLPPQNSRFSGEGAYLITGGTSGLGLLYAKWMVLNGARKIALVSRSGEKPETIAAIDEMKNAGAKVKVYKADISDSKEVQLLLNEIEIDLGKWAGVVHAAGILDDASLLELTQVQFNNVLNAKVKGAWNLHIASIGKNLDTFTLFSSGASVIGTSGQGNYVAANMFLDQLAHLRFNNNMVAKSINWGNIGEVGLAAAQENRGNRLIELGIGAFLPKNLPNYFSALLVAEGPQWMLMDIDFEKWSKGNPSILKNYFYKKVLNLNSETSNENQKTSIYKAATFAQAKRQINEFVKTTVSGITKVPLTKIKEDATFKSMGIDSLMAIQLKNKLQAEFNITLAVSSIWAHPTVDKYGDFLIAELKLKDQYEPTIKMEIQKDTEIESEEMSLEELMKQLEEKTK